MDIVVLCKRCGQSFSVKPSHASRRVFCSKACMDESRREQACALTLADIAPRLLNRVDRSGGPESCWPFTGCTSGGRCGGYGQLTVARKRILAHRLAWEIAFGDPGDQHVLHRCDNPPCCNPAHLFLGTHADNLRDCVSKGRNFAAVYPHLIARGEAHQNSKLTDNDVRRIRMLANAGELHRVIAKQFGVNRSTVTQIAARKGWTHIA